MYYLKIKVWNQIEKYRWKNEKYWIKKKNHEVKNTSKVKKSREIKKLLYELKINFIEKRTKYTILCSKLKKNNDHNNNLKRIISRFELCN